MSVQDESRIFDLEITEEVQRSFLDYAMSVITSRALPDVRDGLKPVHRRVLYAMSQLGIGPTSPYKKSARIVGEIIGKYHPHGDAAVYGTLVRLAQDFSMRYPLVDGHGNFGSIDGDSAAAMRYTEARLTPLAVEMLKDLNKDTVPMVPNYDNEEVEPAVLPSRFPNLLANGIQGIAVGMATNIPPHNLREICNAIIYVIDQDERYEVKDLLAHIKGPDFPTGGIIVNASALPKLYATGTGSVVVEAKIHEETLKNGKVNLIVTELPYMVNKANLVAKIAELVKEKKIDGITNLRDESDRRGMRIVIELKKDVNPEVIKERLMRQTPLRTTFSFKHLVLQNGKPVVMDLKRLVQAYIDHQVEVIKRRTEFDLKKVNERIHVLEGLIVAQNDIDEVIKLIKSAENVDVAKQSLMEKYSLSEEQAQAVVNMRLARLTNLESSRLNEELEEKRKARDEYTHILSSRQNILQVLKKELEELSQKYGDDRRTKIVNKSAKPAIEELLNTIPDERVIVHVTNKGYIKRSPENNIARQKRGNRAKVMTKLQEEEFVTQIFNASTKDEVLLFTNMGMAYKIRVYDIPEKSKAAKGIHVGSLLGKEVRDVVQSIVPLSDGIEYIMFVTQKGYIKKTKVSDFDHINRNGLNSMNVRSGDNIVTVLGVRKDDEVVICTKEGNAIRFRESWVPELPRDSYGVLGIALRNTDAVIDADIVPISRDQSDKKLVIVTSDGYGKLVDLNEYRSQRHGGRGVPTISNTKSDGHVVGIKVVGQDDEIVIVTDNGEINRQPIEGITEYSRYAQGIKLFPMRDNSKVVAISTIIAED